MNHVERSAPRDSKLPPGSVGLQRSNVPGMFVASRIKRRLPLGGEAGSIGPGWGPIYLPSRAGEDLLHPGNGSQALDVLLHCDAGKSVYNPMWFNLADLSFANQLVDTGFCLFPRSRMNRPERFHRRLAQLHSLAAGKLPAPPQVRLSISEQLIIKPDCRSSPVRLAKARLEGRIEPGAFTLELLGCQQTVGQRLDTLNRELIRGECGYAGWQPGGAGQAEQNRQQSKSRPQADVPRCLRR